MAGTHAIRMPTLSSSVKPQNSLAFPCLPQILILLSPQLDPRAIQHLCESCDMRTILVDEAQEELATQVEGGISIVRIPSFRDSHSLNNDCHDENPYQGRGNHETAYFRHTSGTSSGLPKPIAQSHWGAVGCLPAFTDKSQPATFTTTPLYHGGLADCFRAWTSGAMIWVFPEGVVPITGVTVVHSVAYARYRSSVPVKYFSSVPYVLQSLAEENEGIRILQGMDLVGVGGAALAPSVGDRLVELGINLVSRMGSAECGFLMSSHRDYAKDKEWQYLRPIEGPSLLSFEQRGDGLSELVVGSSWPLVAKPNRDDGSYATADLFQAHASILNAWRYHSRADAQITLANGKKFDPSPLEESIKASTPLVRDVLVFGTGKNYAGALLFKASPASSNGDVIDGVWLHVQKLNKETQSHSRLTRSMLIAIDPKGEDPLIRSSKGTILRRQAEARYADLIDGSYSNEGTTSTSKQSISDVELSFLIPELFAQVLGRQIDPRGDLFQQGVDSIACIQIRRLIESSIFAERSPRLPLNIIYDSGNVHALTENVIRIRMGNDLCGRSSDADELDLMRKLSERYSKGATGALGAHILSALCSDARVRKVYCLLRGQTKHAAQERVSKALSKRGLPSSQDPDTSQVADSKVVCLPCQLSEPHLGLSGEECTGMVTEASVFIHAAWAVNFSLHLSSFEAHILGTQNMIKAAVSSGARFFFVSSTAAVSSDPYAVIAEKESLDPSHASPLGYSRSKWVAERVCAKARGDLYTNMLTTGSSSTDISIIRVGQLCGNEAGVWNASEAYPLMLSTAGFVGCLPDLPDESLNWLPVDEAAKIVLEIALPDQIPETRLGVRMPIYHVLNIHKSPSWNQLLQWSSESPGGPSFQIVEPPEWLGRLDLTLRGSHAGHPSQALLGLWKRRYTHAISTSEKDDEGHNTTRDPPTFDVTSSLRLSQTMEHVGPLSRDRVVRMWSWIQKNVT
ncbi:hypothetical protein F4804DRAFT_304028 [Jackrogersella minutella]|nr:hypothetical protein F4804DRAFT_304028 [Jackrogersella minutella]